MRGGGSGLDVVCKHLFNLDFGFTGGHRHYRCLLVCDFRGRGKKGSKCTNDNSDHQKNPPLNIPNCFYKAIAMDARTNGESLFYDWWRQVPSGEKMRLLECEFIVDIKICKVIFNCASVWIE